jgi:hypothetical protein
LLRPGRVASAHARAACASAPRLPHHHALAPLTPARPGPGLHLCSCVVPLTCQRYARTARAAAVRLHPNPARPTPCSNAVRTLQCYPCSPHLLTHAHLSRTPERRHQPLARATRALAPALRRLPPVLRRSRAAPAPCVRAHQLSSRRSLGPLLLCRASASSCSPACRGSHAPPSQPRAAWRSASRAAPAPPAPLTPRSASARVGRSPAQRAWCRLGLLASRASRASHEPPFLPRPAARAARACAEPRRRPRSAPRGAARTACSGLRPLTAARAKGETAGREGGKRSAACGRNERRQGEDRTEREEKQRRRRKQISQGLMRNFRKLQGLVCKAKFTFDLKPE